jgi:hypothetical protein
METTEVFVPGLGMLRSWASNIEGQTLHPIGISNLSRNLKVKIVEV